MFTLRALSMTMPSSPASMAEPVMFTSPLPVLICTPLPPATDEPTPTVVVVVSVVFFFSMPKPSR